MVGLLLKVLQKQQEANNVISQQWSSIKPGRDPRAQGLFAASNICGSAGASNYLVLDKVSKKKQCHVIQLLGGFLPLATCNHIARLLCTKSLHSKSRTSFKTLSYRIMSLIVALPRPSPQCPAVVSMENCNIPKAVAR